MGKKYIKRVVFTTERYMTLREVAAEMDMTSERVRQIEAKALKKIKAALESRGLTAEWLLPDNFDSMKA